MHNGIRKCFSIFFSLMIFVAGVLLTGYLMREMPLILGEHQPGAQAQSFAPQIMDKLDMYMTNWLSDSMGELISVKKVYWLSDEDLVAPEPNEAKYGETDDVEELRQLMENAQELLEGQTCYFSPDKEFKPGTKVQYYLDETLFVVTWKEIHDRSVYSFSEVKIGHPSQLRRFLSEGVYGCGRQYYTTEMAAGVNAVVAISGDFYGYRPNGTMVYNGTVHRLDAYKLHTCLIDENGDFYFVEGGFFKDIGDAQNYVDENHIRFSLCFGPVLVKDGELQKYYSYALGQIDQCYARAVICQMDTCHYLLCTANYEPMYYRTPDLLEFGTVIQATGCKSAYTLDGGQTATLVMRDKLFNQVSYGNQRLISDIVYFATAVPEEEG